MSTHHATSGPGREDGWYRIRIQGHLDRRWAAWSATRPSRRVVPSGSWVRDSPSNQAALHGLLTKVRDMGLPLVSVTGAGADSMEG